MNFSTKWTAKYYFLIPTWNDILFNVDPEKEITYKVDHSNEFQYKVDRQILFFSSNLKWYFIQCGPWKGNKPQSGPLQLISVQCGPSCEYYFQISIRNDILFKVDLANEINCVVDLPKWTLSKWFYLCFLNWMIYHTMWTSWVKKVTKWATKIVFWSKWNFEPGPLCSIFSFSIRSTLYKFTSIW